jgi:urease accessory protein
MLSEKVLGNIQEEQFQNLTIDYVDIEWHEAFKKLHKKTTRSGEEIGIRLDNDILLKGLKDGDVLYADATKAVVVNIPECEVIVVDVPDDCLIPKVCYEIGNRHAALCYGEHEKQFVTPYNQPMFEMLEKIHKHKNGACIKAVVTKKRQKLNFHHAISSTINHHTH